MEKETVIKLAADIVSAHVSNNNVPTDGVAQLIQSVYTALADAGSPVAEVKQEPAVSIRSSVKPAAIACLECGRKMKILKRHLTTEHGLSPVEYRSKWGLATNYPLVAPDYAAKRAELAKKIGLGRKPGTGKKPTVVKKARVGRPKKASTAPALPGSE